jgi:hypothetical protein
MSHVNVWDNETTINLFVSHDQSTVIPGNPERMYCPVRHRDDRLPDGDKDLHEFGLPSFPYHILEKIQRTIFHDAIMNARENQSFWIIWELAKLTCIALIMCH